MNSKTVLVVHQDLLKKIVKKIQSGSKLTHAELFALKEVERVDAILRGEVDPGPQIGIECARRALEVNRSVLTEWRKQGFPETIDEAIPATALIKWLREKWVDLRDNADPEMGVGNSPALERFRTAKAGQEEIKLAKVKEEMIEVSEVQSLWYKILSAAWNQIAKWRDTMPPLMANKTAGTIRKFIMDETERAGEEILKELEKLKGKSESKKKAD